MIAIPVAPATSICGIWADDAGRIFTTVATPGGGREERIEVLRPFAWLNGTPADEVPTGLSLETLNGEGPFNRLVHAESLSIFNVFVRTEKAGISTDVIRPLESQYLLQQRQRLFRELSFSEVRRCQFDIEVASPGGGFPDARAEAPEMKRFLDASILVEACLAQSPKFAAAEALVKTVGAVTSAHAIPRLSM